MAEDVYRVELTSSFLQRLDAIEAFLPEADAAHAVDKLLAELRAMVFRNLARFPRIGRRYLDNRQQSAEALAQFALLPALAEAKKLTAARPLSSGRRPARSFRKSDVAAVRERERSAAPSSAAPKGAGRTSCGTCARGAQRDAGLHHKQMPEAARRQIRSLGHLGQRNGLVDPLADVFHSRQYAQAGRWLTRSGAGNLAKQLHADGLDYVETSVNAPGPLEPLCGDR